MYPMNLRKNYLNQCQINFPTSLLFCLFRKKGFASKLLCNTKNTCAASEFTVDLTLSMESF
ncbi:hypothetical protein BpHYR1_009577 [Brachionus plicatilis]|uniref:Uncharacterized protein n=1 Tax=Brachionus plicatilis TaxID=10195 RepID=A0A3M7T8C5_BRAPC|nr:hypothetical protein BpHYR1_009577 [Brachionus plicatilis]